MNSTVYVFGSINADTSYRMSVLPGPGETVIASSAQTSPGGKGANQAIAAAAAGSVAQMVGLVGNDADAAALVHALEQRGVGTTSITNSGAPTGRAVVYVDDAGENSIVVLSGANQLLSSDHAARALASIATGDVLVLQNEVPAAANRSAARMAQLAGATVVWNAAPAPATAADLVREIDLLIVNEHELVQLSGLLGVRVQPHEPTVTNLEALLAATAEALDADAICTLGSAGAIYVADGVAGRVPAPKVRAIDTTAAGDTVVGYLAAHSSLPIEARLRLAAAAGALTVTREGASSSIPQFGEVDRMFTTLTERTPA